TKKSGVVWKTWLRIVWKAKSCVIDAAATRIRNAGQPRSSPVPCMTASAPTAPAAAAVPAMNSLARSGSPAGFGLAAEWSVIYGSPTLEPQADPHAEPDADPHAKLPHAEPHALPQAEPQALPHAEPHAAPFADATFWSPPHITLPHALPHA